MAIILGLDISKHAGWAIYDTKRHVSSIENGVMEFPDKASVEYCADQMGLKIAALIKKYRPDFIVLETALKMSPAGTMATVVSCMLHGAVLATIANFGTPWGTISSQTWRKMFFGQGFKPPQKITKLSKPDPKTGKLEKVENLWKQAVIEQCEREKIPLPAKKTNSDNAAEASAIAICWRGAEIKAGRYREPFQKLLQQRNERQATSDLFAGEAA
jgi:Holliday junction resolvasome RuvABC endonuclease subunit